MCGITRETKQLYNAKVHGAPCRKSKVEADNKRIRPDFIGTRNFNSVASHAQSAGTESQRDIDGFRYDAFYSGIL